MQLGKYVFILRPDGSLRHRRYQDWCRFLSGQREFDRPSGNIPRPKSILTIECQLGGITSDFDDHSVKSVSSSMPLTSERSSTQVKLFKRLTQINTSGKYESSCLSLIELAELDDLPVLRTAVDYLMSSVLQSSCPSVAANTSLGKVLCCYIDDLLSNESSNSASQSKTVRPNEALAAQTSQSRVLPVTPPKATPSVLILEQVELFDEELKKTPDRRRSAVSASRSALSQQCA